jgi:hypothetical protein
MANSEEEQNVKVPFTLAWSKTPRWIRGLERGHARPPPQKNRLLKASD